uniref:Exosome complex component RRP45 n=1 Tax=Timema cristinae TaxID=61476 RepID=A0A7R9CJK8_TIMCR|nr:unnamed protein product [Timema cristinae]
MKEALLSNCERTFVLQALSEGKRIDGREIDEFREMEIFFGTDWGCCQVSLGDTKYVRTDLELSPMETPSMDVTDISQITRLFSSLRVLAQVSCDVMAPKATRPNEGLLHINVELSPMGAPHFESGRLSELGVQLNRLLEKAIKDSHCVDLESLCIVAEEKVFNLRVDIHILNHEGNLVEAASIAALTALGHFRRPDVTMTGEKTIIHDPSERDPIPVVLHHHPVCVSYALFNKGSPSLPVCVLHALQQGVSARSSSLPVCLTRSSTRGECKVSLPPCFLSRTVVVADPTALEERVSEAQIVFGMNAYRELCGLHLGGSALATFETVVNCAIRAGNRAAQVVQKIKTLLAQDAETRWVYHRLRPTTDCAWAAGKPVGFTDCIRQPNVLAMSQDRLAIRLHRRDLRETARNLVSVRTGRVERSKTTSSHLGSWGCISTWWLESLGELGVYIHLVARVTWGAGGNMLSTDEDEDEPTLLSLGNGSAELVPSRGKSGKYPLELSDSEEEEKGTLYPGDLEPPGGREQQMSDMASNKNQASESDDSTTTRSWYPKKTPW